MRIEFRIDADGSRTAVIEEENMVPGAECEGWLTTFTNICEDMTYEARTPEERALRRHR